MPTYVALFGVQGSGKGTQAALLSEQLGLPVISVGKMFRDQVRRGTKLGKEVEAYIKAGELVPNEITSKMVKRRLAQKDAKKGAIFDGYPRSVEQAESLDEMINLSLVIVLKITDKEALERIKNRRQCKNGHIYHLIYKPPKKKGVCDEDGLELYQRADDKPKAIKERIETYHEETKPLLKYYKKRGILCEVDGMGKPETVTKRLRTCI